MSILVSEALSRLGHVLHDVDHFRFTEAELIDWMNDAAGEIVVRRPPSNTVTENVTLVTGAKQNIPAGGVQLIDVKRNVSSTKKYPIQRADRHTLESMDTTWYDKEVSLFVRNYSYEDRIPTEFYVWPAVTAGVEIEISYSKLPDEVVDNTGTIELPRELIGPLVSYVLFRAHSKDGEDNNNAAAMGAYQAFVEALGSNTQAQLAVSPKGTKA